MVQHYVIKFVSDLWQGSGFLWILPVSSTNKTDRHNITEILLKVVFKHHNPNPKTIEQEFIKYEKKSLGMRKGR